MEGGGGIGDVEEVRFGPAIALVAPARGRYPDGRSLLVRGRSETVLVDPSLGVRPQGDVLRGEVDWCLLSHGHEDHVAALDLFADRPVRLHEADAPALASLDAFMALYGFPPDVEGPWRRAVVERFHFAPRPDAQPLRDGARFDLGGRSITAVHTPGHTRGHCCLLVEGAGEPPLLYLGDIDLSSFGPYYGDAWSSLDDFERSLDAVRRIDARWYATFHHVGVVGRAEFLERLERFARVIATRDERLLAFLAQPRTLDEIVAHRFVYRPGDAVPFADAVERRSMGQHLARALADGRAREVEPGRFARRD
ncbi:MAG: MBL fold metallo-hydrolase [Myxococcales bacterium]|nr:MBL fold metallo-hydrolase [Myxococcales bacterium]